MHTSKQPPHSSCYIVIYCRSQSEQHNECVLCFETSEGFATFTRNNEEMKAGQNLDDAKGFGSSLSGLVSKSHQNVLPCLETYSIY